MYNLNYIPTTLEDKIENKLHPRVSEEERLNSNGLAPLHDA
jgi:hypothetical protein